MHAALEPRSVRMQPPLGPAFSVSRLPGALFALEFTVVSPPNRMPLRSPRTPFAYFFLLNWQLFLQSDDYWIIE